jgi:glycosidase
MAAAFDAERRKGDAAFTPFTFMKRTLRTLACLAALGGLCLLADVPVALSVPRFTHPGSGQVFYFLLTDRFANGDTSNDHGGIAGGREKDGFDPTVISHFHGGDLAGLSARLDYLQKLGVTAIWTTPVFVNNPVQAGTAGYHGYWINDFTRIDPHLGTDQEFRDFVAKAHARGIRVYLDIVINHTGDVIFPKDKDTSYKSLAEAPFLDADGKPFDVKAVAYNGLGDASSFPRLSAERSFAHTPALPPGQEHVKGPEWLNDVTLYHNRGNSLFRGENALYGDFAGLDDVFTEHPTVVKGFIEVYSKWIRDYGVDGFRIDTMKHVNMEFWQAFGPAIRGQALAVGKPEFFQFGEVMDSNQDAAFLSEFPLNQASDASIDFPLTDAIRDVISRQHPTSELARLIAKDDYYTSHDTSADGIPTFLSNHDWGRFAGFLQEDNPGIADKDIQDLLILAHSLLFTVRGQPVLYYGDEQGMKKVGNDMASREDMFPSKARSFAEMSLLGTTRKGSDDKFDEQHPLYRRFAALSSLRTKHPGLAHGSMLMRSTSNDRILAFSRFNRDEKVEYLIALNSSRSARLNATLATSQQTGGVLREIYNSGATQPGSTLSANTLGQVSVDLAPLQLVVWKAEKAQTVPQAAPTIQLTSPLTESTLAFGIRSVDGQEFAIRQEIRAELDGSDGLAEVTFLLERSSRPGQYQLLGTDDAAPYRVFWRPSADLRPGEELSFIAVVDDLRGHRSSTRVDHIRVAPNAPAFGIRGATIPVLSNQPAASQVGHPGSSLTFSIKAEGTGPLTYQWYHNGAPVAGATASELTLTKLQAADAGSYYLKVHNREGSTLSAPLTLTVAN